MRWHALPSAKKRRNSTGVRACHEMRPLAPDGEIVLCYHEPGGQWNRHLTDPYYTRPGGHYDGGGATVGSACFLKSRGRRVTLHTSDSS